MTFQEALELIRHQPAYILGRDEVKLALAEQIEANRVAIEHIARHLNSGMLSAAIYCPTTNTKRGTDESHA